MLNVTERDFLELFGVENAEGYVKNPDYESPKIIDKGMIGGLPYGIVRRHSLYLTPVTNKAWQCGYVLFKNNSKTNYYEGKGLDDWDDTITFMFSKDNEYNSCEYSPESWKEVVLENLGIDLSTLENGEEYVTIIGFDCNHLYNRNNGTTDNIEYTRDTVSELIQCLIDVGDVPGK